MLKLNIFAEQAEANTQAELGVAMAIFAAQLSFEYSVDDKGETSKKHYALLKKYVTSEDGKALPSNVKKALNTQLSEYVVNIKVKHPAKLTSPLLRLKDLYTKRGGRYGKQAGVLYIDMVEAFHAGRITLRIKSAIKKYNLTPTTAKFVKDAIELGIRGIYNPLT